jgi:hypothetical protein
MSTRGHDVVPAPSRPFSLSTSGSSAPAWPPATGCCAPPRRSHHPRRGRATPACRPPKRVKEWQPDALVVGVPFHPDGASHDNTARARKFARQLRGRFGLPVYEVDERYSTTEALAARRAMPTPARPASSWNSS